MAFLALLLAAQMAWAITPFVVRDIQIDGLQRTEPGNPAPLLIQRAKRLVGVSFLDIMADLAPDALQSIENITGRPPSDAG